jgi:hypothetical protein
MMFKKSKIKFKFRIYYFSLVFRVTFISWFYSIIELFILFVINKKKSIINIQQWVIEHLQNILFKVINFLNNHIFINHFHGIYGCTDIY